MPDSADKMVWIDLETTGLDPNTGKILECAVVITDDTTLEEEHAESWVIYHEYLDLKSMTPNVLEMHSDSGLLADLMDFSTVHWYTVAERLTDAVVAACALGPTKKPLLAGNTVSFDRAWLKKHAPALDGYLHHRNLDVSSIYEMLLRSQWRNRAIEIKESEAVAHRAMADVRKSIEMYRLFRDLCGLSPQADSFDDMRS